VVRSESDQYKISSRPDRDSWDRWNSEPSNQNADSTSPQPRTRSQDWMPTGVAEHAGLWGCVFQRTDGWFPIGCNWTYEPTYGWTWVGYSPGMGAVSYGRWFPNGNSWAWWPDRPMRATTRSGRLRMSRSSDGAALWFRSWLWRLGRFRWLPIGPCDYYHPWWGGYRNQFGVVNITNIHVNNFHQYGVLPHCITDFATRILRTCTTSMSAAMSTMNAVISHQPGESHGSQ